MDLRDGSFSLKGLLVGHAERRRPWSRYFPPIFPHWACLQGSPFVSLSFFIPLYFLKYLTMLTSPDDVDLKQDQQWVLHSFNRWHRHVVGYQAIGQNIKINSFFSDKIALKTKDKRRYIRKRHNSDNWGATNAQESHNSNWDLDNSIYKKLINNLKIEI